MNKGRNDHVKKRQTASSTAKTAGSAGEFYSSRDRQDEEKVDEFLRGRKEALGELFRKYRGTVYEIAYRFVQNREDALEVTQEVFVKVVESIGKFRRGARFYTWLYRIAVNHSIDFLRRRKVRRAVPVDYRVLQSHSSRADPVRIAEDKELGQRLECAFQQLGEKHRTVLALHSLEELSYREIGQIVGCSPGTVMSRLFYARKRLAEILGEV